MDTGAAGPDRLSPNMKSEHDGEPKKFVAAHGEIESETWARRQHRTKRMKDSVDASSSGVVKP